MLTAQEKKEKILNFIDKFPDCPTGWEQATDELPDIHDKLAEYFPDYHGATFVSYGGTLPDEVKKIASLRNQTHKTRIKKLLSEASDYVVNQVFSFYEEWFINN